MNREILDAIEEQTDLRYDSLADAAGWYGTTTAWREDFTANWNSTGPKRAVKRQLNRDKEAEEMAKAKIKIKVSDSGIVWRRLCHAERAGGSAGSHDLRGIPQLGLCRDYDGRRRQPAV